jgi:hypothetical protein
MAPSSIVHSVVGTNIARLALGVWLWQAAPACAQEVWSYVSRDTVTVGERFSLFVVAEHAGEAVPVFPSPDSQAVFGDLEVLHRSGPLSRPLPERPGFRQDSLVYEVTTFALDTASVPALPVYFLRGADTVLADTYPIVVPVRSLVTAEDQDIRGLAPLATFPVVWWPWLLGALLVGGLGYAAYRHLSRRPAPEPVVFPLSRPQESPYAYATRRLAELQKRADLHDLKQVKPYYVELAEIIRIYVSRRLRIPAMESTTFELMGMLRRRTEAKVVPEEVLPKAQQIFRVLDLVKFADLLPPPHVGQEALARSKNLIDTIESALLAAEAKAAEPAPSPAVPREA